MEMFTNLDPNGIVSYLGHEVNRFVYEGYEVVCSGLFSKAKYPAITLKYSSFVFNVHTIRMFDNCRHIQILMHSDKKFMVIKPCDEDAKDSLQWSNIDMHGKVVPRKIAGKLFTAKLYKEMKWDLSDTVKLFGTLLKGGDEKIFVFDLKNSNSD